MTSSDTHYRHMPNEIFFRVNQLERSLRAFRSGVLLLSFVLLALLVVTTTGRARAGDEKADGVYQARGIVIVDKDGNVRGSWSCAEDGDTVGLILNDGKGKQRMALFVDKLGHAEVSFLDERGEPRATLAAAPNDRTELLLSDTKGNPRFKAGVEPNGTFLQLNDERGITRAMCSVLAAPGLGKAEFGLYDKSQKRRWAAFSATDGTPGIVFPDPSDPARILGGWFAKEGAVEQMPKGATATSIGGS